MTEDELLQAAADAQRFAFLEGFKNYGMLLNTMSPNELATEIGKYFDPMQAAILTTLAYRIFRLEENGKDTR